MKIQIPEFALVVLIGASGSGKSTFAKTHFGPFETISSDYCRGLVSNSETDQSATTDAFELLHIIASKRLQNMKLTVIDATNVQDYARKSLLEVAKTYHALPVAIILDPPLQVCIERNEQRADRDFGPRVIAQHRRQLRHSLKRLKREGFRRIYHLDSLETIEAAEIIREPLWNNREDLHGPFDLIGDIHGCYDELVLLLERLGYQIDGEQVKPPEGRTAIFLGDLVDRGPKTPAVLKLVMNMVAAGTALCIPGNHDMKLKRALEGRNVQRTHGLAESLEQLEAETPAFREQVKQFLDGLISHYVLDRGNLVVAHAGMREELAGRASGKVRDFALYGETTGETDEYGLPVRYNWAAEYRGKAIVVYGHTPVPQPEWLNRTINIDTGCVFGGALTALRYPEQELVSVEALEMYTEPVRPFRDVAESGLSAQQQNDDVLDLADVLGKRIVSTRLRANITIRDDQSTAALEVMSRFAINPRWLVYLPPTMSPSETSQLPGYLEHPTEAFAYYRSQGVGEVMCEEKHMGSRAIVIVCQDEQAAQTGFGIVDEGIGIVYTRNGRRFFNDLELEQAFLAHVRDALTTANYWDEFQTGWMILDCELMPWSAKAQQLIQYQYAAVGAAGQAALRDSITVLEQAASNGIAVDALLQSYRSRAEHIEHYRQAYRNYCWHVELVTDLQLAPFQLLATEGAVHVDKDHRWHMETLSKLTQSELIHATEYRILDVNDEVQCAEASAWWEAMTTRGGEGMVVKPLAGIVRGQRGWVQPGIKVRGPEYLRIIYGPEYLEQLEVLRQRGLHSKRSLALREWALGIEALERFVRQEPLRRVHECVFGVVALESEPVDPRL